MKSALKASRLLALAAAIALTAQGRVVAEMPDTDVVCALTAGCRVVGSPQTVYWCCCKTSTGEDCDTISSGVRNPTIMLPQNPGANSQPAISRPLNPLGIAR